MTTVEVKSSWQSIFEWILRSDKLNKYVTTYFTTEENLQPLYNLYVAQYEKELKKTGKKRGRSSEESRRSSELSFGSPPQKRPKTIEEFVKYLYINIGKYERTQRYVLNELHKIRDEYGNNILHIMASVNATDVHSYMVLDKYHGRALWLQTNTSNEIPLHLLFQHPEISPLVFKFVVDNSILGFGIQNKYGNNVLHVFFSKYSNQDFQTYIIDKYKMGQIPLFYLNTYNSLGETPITIYNRNVKWYINNEVKRLKLKSPPLFQQFEFEKHVPKYPTEIWSRVYEPRKPTYIPSQPILERTDTLAELLVGIKDTAKRARAIAAKSSSSDDSEKRKSKKPKVVKE